MADQATKLERRRRSKLNNQVRYAAWRLDMWLAGHGTYEEIDRAVRRGELEPFSAVVSKV